MPGSQQLEDNLSIYTQTISLAAYSYMAIASVLFMLTLLLSVLIHVTERGAWEQCCEDASCGDYFCWVREDGEYHHLLRSSGIVSGSPSSP
eukprot:TRINITY_DN2208_c0_g1_i1.p1 TRINITY_DN2208_c0_g1~~TRINITY_DN2208_c0_g1_i1.p1  ORF type:complete len:91 (-),score=7.02 TRINITY_DN2208_c0_g1_i1:127-399(-)